MDVSVVAAVLAVPVMRLTSQRSSRMIRPLQVPLAAVQRGENREGGVSPPRAQRCEEDVVGRCHWCKPGRRRRQVNPSQKTGLKSLRPTWPVGCA